MKMMNVSKGNMYGFVTHTWNAIKGKCSHDCGYCYMKVFGELKPLKLDKNELKSDLGNGNFIFVGSSTDMFANDVNFDWISDVIYHCNKFDNKYLFQSKNPKRMLSCVNSLCEKDSILGTTIETNRVYPEMGNTTIPYERAYFMRRARELGYATMITIEPIMDFDLEDFVAMLRYARPLWVNIGADSKNHNLKEPEYKKILLLKEKLEDFTEVKKKINLKRIESKENIGDE